MQSSVTSGAPGMRRDSPHTRGIKPYGLFGGILDHAAEQVIRQIRAVDIGHIGAQHERWLLLAGNLLQKTRLADGQLNGIRIRLHQGLHRGIKILNALQKLRSLKNP